MSSWLSPQYSEHRIGNWPTAVGVKSMTTGSPPRGISFLTLNFLISMPCTPSPDRTMRRTRLADGHFDLGGFEGEPRGDTSMTRGSAACPPQPGRGGG